LFDYGQQAKKEGSCRERGWLSVLLSLSTCSTTCFREGPSVFESHLAAPYSHTPVLSLQALVPHPVSAELLSYAQRCSVAVRNGTDCCPAEGVLLEVGMMGSAGLFR